MSIYKEPPPGMFVVPDPHDMTKVGGIQVLCSPIKGFSNNFKEVLQNIMTWHMCTCHYWKTAINSKMSLIFCNITLRNFQ